eukprot:4278723-Lingulodinium_polyedra.AAC.1
MDVRPRPRRARATNMIDAVVAVLGEGVGRRGSLLARGVQPLHVIEPGHGVEPVHGIEPARGVQPVHGVQPARGVQPAQPFQP